MKSDNIAQALTDLQNGKMILVIDDPGRENEGDLICAAQYATPEIINFMASRAKGLICMPMSREWTGRLDLEQMVTENTDSHTTAFTVSIDHVSTGTGISAYERSVTAVKCADGQAAPDDFRRPGHMFPLEARPDGVLERPGHTEATVDLLRLAGLREAGLCCEIMDDNGAMMRTAELTAFAKANELTLVSIRELINYRRQAEGREEEQVNYAPVMEQVVTAKLPTRYGNFTIHGYVNTRTEEHHVALTMGSVDDGEPVLVRVHSECLTGDALGSAKCDCGDQYDAAMQAISAAGRGVLVYLRQEGRGIGLINKLKAYALQDDGLDTVEANLALGFPADPRDYTAGAEILVSLGVKRLRLLTNNPDKVISLEQFGLEITQRIPIETARRHDSDSYMMTKKAKMGHVLNSY